MYNDQDLYVLDFSGVNHASEIHEILRKTFDFPDYYGCNWDAFWDCITDMLGRPLHIEIRGLQHLEQKFETHAKNLISALTRLKQFGNGAFADQIEVAVVLDGRKIILP